MKTPLWISLHKLKTHSLHQTIRSIAPRPPDWAVVFDQLGDLVEKSLTKTGKSLTALAMLSLVILNLSDGRDINFELGSFSLTAPTSAAIFLSSLSFVGIVFQALHLLVLLEYRADFSARKPSRWLSTAAYDAYREKSYASLGTPFLTLPFLKPNTSLLSYLGTAIMILMVSLLVFPIYLIYEMLSLGIEIIRFHDFNFLDFLLIASSFFATLCSFCLVVLDFLPLPYRKDRSSIRWGFLYDCAGGQDHPMIPSWLASDSRDKKS